MYGQPNVRADADGYAVEALGDDQGGSNIISAGLVALLSGHEIRAVRAAARTGECYIKLDWTFPGSPYPKFTTRHLLHPSDSTGAVSFSGGLDWAYRMLDSAQSLHIPANQPSQEHASSPMSNPSFTSRHKLPSWMNLIQRHGTPRPPGNQPLSLREAFSVPPLTRLQLPTAKFSPRPGREDHVLKVHTVRAGGPEPLRTAAWTGKVGISKNRWRIPRPCMPGTETRADFLP